MPKKKTTRKSLIVIEEKSMPLIIGECNKCQCGDRTLVIVNYMKNNHGNHLDMVKIKCISCFKENFKFVSEITKKSSA